MNRLFEKISIVALVCLAPSIVRAAGDLDLAYKREFAFLEAEKKALYTRLSEIEEEAAKATAQAKAEVDALQRRAIALTADVEEMEDDISDIEDKSSQTSEKSDLLLETMSRASDTMRRHGYEISEPSNDPEIQATQILNLFNYAARVLEKGQSIHEQDGEFFLNDGSRVSGKILTLGNVAAYGMSARGGGALAPAGGERFKTWHEPAYATAKDLIDGKRPLELEMFLFESLEKGVEETKEQTVLEHIDSGGVIAWVIVSLGIVAMLMMVTRVVILLRAGSRTDKLLEAVGPLVDEGRNEEAIGICQKTKSAAARVLKTTIRNLRQERQHLEDIISEAILHEAPTVERFGTTILVVAAVAPLLGLLGTVTGMITTFDIITEFGTGDPKLLSGGISVALVTTEVGLIVAIPTLLIGTLLSGGASSIMDGMERAALQIMNRADAFKARENSSNAGKEEKPAGTESRRAIGAAEGATA